MKRTRLMCMILAMAFCVIGTVDLTPVYAANFIDYDNINRVSRLDISSGYVYGERVDYTFKLPDAWGAYCYVDREIIKDNSAYLEKLKFYCVSVSKRYKPAPLFTLTVYDRIVFSWTYAYDYVINTKRYVYAVEFGADRPFDDERDMAIYNYCMSKIKPGSKLKSYFEFPKGQGEINENTLVVGDNVLGERIYISDGNYYVPLRVACEALGYRVDWSARDNSVLVRKTSFSDRIYLSDGATSGGIKFVIADGCTYIAPAYFFRVLGRNVEIDAYGNVYIL